MQKHATCPAKKVTTLSATRGAGLAQIAIAPIEPKLEFWTYHVSTLSELLRNAGAGGGDETGAEQVG
jgi:hypothetical protein